MTDSTSLSPGRPADLAGSLQMGDIAQFTEKGLRLKPEATPEDVAGLVDSLMLMHQGIQFWVGDAINQSEDRDGDRIWQYVTQATVLNWCSVSRRIPAEERFLELSYAHHRAVTSLERHERRVLLETAVAEGWSSRRLEKEARRKRNGPVVRYKECPQCGGRGIIEEHAA